MIPINNQKSINPTGDGPLKITQYNVLGENPFFNEKSIYLCYGEKWLLITRVDEYTFFLICIYPNRWNPPQQKKSWRA